MSSSDIKKSILQVNSTTLPQAEIDIARRLFDRKPHAEHKLSLLHNLCAVNHNPGVYIQAIHALVKRGAISYNHGWYSANKMTGAIVEGDMHGEIN